jgi:hypothetical protein
MQRRMGKPPRQSRPYPSIYGGPGILGGLSIRTRFVTTFRITCKTAGKGITPETRTFVPRMAGKDQSPAALLILSCGSLTRFEPLSLKKCLNRVRTQPRPWSMRPKQFPAIHSHNAFPAARASEQEGLLRVRESAILCFMLFSGLNH